MPDKQTLNVGTVANDGTGDTLRAAAGKINSNMDNLWTAVYDGTVFSRTDRVKHIIPFPTTLLFGVIAMGNTSDINTFMLTLDLTLAEDHVVDLGGHTYGCDETINLTNLDGIRFTNGVFTRGNGNPNLVGSPLTYWPVFELTNCTRCSFDNMEMKDDRVEVAVNFFDGLSYDGHFSVTPNPTIRADFEVPLDPVKFARNGVPTAFMKLTNSNDITLDNCRMLDIVYGVIAAGSEKQRRIDIRNCTFSTSSGITDGKMGDAVYGNGLLDDCTFTNNSVKNAMSAVNTGSVGNRWNVSNNLIENTINSAVFLRGKGHVVTGNTITYSGRDGIEVQTDPTPWFGKVGIDSDEGSSSITGNVVKFAGYYQEGGGMCIRSYGANNIVSTNFCEIDSAANMNVTSLAAGVSIAGRNTIVSSNSIVGPYAFPNTKASIAGNSYYGIRLASSETWRGNKCIIGSNNIRNVTSGITAIGASAINEDHTLYSTQISNNSISGSKWGIYIVPEDKTGVFSDFMIKDNIIDSCESTGMWFKGSGPIIVEGNSFNNMSDKIIRVGGVNDVGTFRNNVWDGETLDPTTDPILVEVLATESIITELGNSWNPKESTIVNVSTQTADYSANVITDSTILVDATIAAVTITLPTAVGYTGKNFRIKKVDNTANAVIIDADGSETIDGAFQVTISTQYGVSDIVSDGTNWHIC